MKVILFSLALIQGGLARADLDASQAKGLEDTKQLLRNRAERDAAVKRDSSAAAADQRVETLTGGGAQKDAVYGISADVMDKLTKQTNGDPIKMQEILGEAVKNPEAFYNTYFDDAAKAKVRGVANAINQPATPAQH